jgi:hypothetical protein
MPNTNVVDVVYLLRLRLRGQKRALEPLLFDGTGGNAGNWIEVTIVGNAEGLQPLKKFSRCRLGAPFLQLRVEALLPPRSGK